MRYANNLNANLVLSDLPALTLVKGEGQRSSRVNFFERVAKQLVIYDRLPEEDSSSVLGEAIISLEEESPGFEAIFPTAFESYIESSKHLARWQKLAHDYNYYVEQETKRRDKGNPYHPQDVYVVQSWEELPDFSKQRKNMPWQFDNLNRDAQILAGEVYELTKDYQDLGDRDMFRARVNSILVPDRIIFALSGDHNNFFENEINLINLKLDLDGYKLAHKFLTRVVESLTKIKWKVEDKHKDLAEKMIQFAEDLQGKLRNRIIETEKRYLLFSDYDSDVQEH
jgi:hypothetical protein